MLSPGKPLSDAPQPSASPNARFLAGTARRGADERVRFGNSIIGSACTHIGGLLFAAFLIDNVQVTPPSTAPVDDKKSNIVWLKVPGPGRRGRDGGDGRPAVPRTTERPRRDTLPPAAAPPPTVAQAQPKDAPTEVNVQAIEPSPAVVELPGALTGLPTVSWQGSDAKGGVGVGTGRRGSGSGGGSDDGMGTGAFGPGNGVTMPTVVREVKPSYTAEAMRAHVQGAVRVEAIVREDGSVGQVRIVRSLDRTFGLDEEALRAVRNWRFRPGKREGQNVAVIVEIELMFTLR